MSSVSGDMPTWQDGYQERPNSPGSSYKTALPLPPSMKSPARKNLGEDGKAPYLSRGRCSRFQPG